MIDLLASADHYRDHLRPVWQAIPPELRGDILEPDDLRTARDRITIVSSSIDLRLAGRAKRKVVLLEHGTGQSYSSRHASYVGGQAREKVALYLAPSERVADRHRRYYRSPAVVIGSPRVDELRARALTPDPSVVAISFHWRGPGPEAGTALDHYAAGLADARLELERVGLELIGHAHPRILEEIRPIYAAAGLELVDSFDDVIARAGTYVVDNSSTLFEFAALDRPVVVLNSPAYRRDVEHGLRFWSEADIGLNVEEPDELASSISYASHDPDHLARSRRAAVARAYSVLDGRAADRAAEAIVNLSGGRRSCLVCGAAHATCGPPTDVVAIDQMREPDMKTKGPKAYYPNPERPGAFLKLTEEHAARLGLAGQADDREPPALDIPEDFTSEPGTPDGALSPGGPTARARAKAEEEAGPEPDAEGQALEEDDVDDKKRPAPVSRRRRAATK